MSQQQRNHETAIEWIEGEIRQLIRTLDEKNAGAGASSAISLALLLGAIDLSEHDHFRERITRIYKSARESSREMAA